MEITIELCPAIRASVQASHPDSPSRVKNVCRNEYSTNGAIGFRLFFFASLFTARNALACCFFRLEWSMCSLLVGAGHAHPSDGFPAAFQRDSRTARTLGAIGSARRAGAVFLCVLNGLPLGLFPLLSFPLP